MRRHNGVLAILFHILFVAFMLGPILVVCAVAFTPNGYLSFPTSGLSLRWFKQIAEYPEFFRAAKTSLLLGTLSSTLALALATPAALGIARHRFPGRGTFSALFMSPLMIPQVVLGVALLRFFNQVGLAGTFGGLVLAHIIIIFPFTLRLTLASAIGMDPRLEQAATSLGAPRHVVFRRVVLPMVLPGMVSGWILAFIQSFDEVTMTVFIATPGTETLPVRMFAYITDNIDPLVTSVSACVIAVTAVLMVIADRLFGLDAILLGDPDARRK
ncbi:MULTISPECIES: ABC transporter permease [Roseobacteraceae]|uniref:ABC transporter permease n=1 Tax=Roseobacteraceae TaxID=2854170 RepID=UPI00080A99A1|nr:MULTISPECIES: ABC transporter permease [Roseobacteraceae]ANT63771.1 ABC transporter permease [Salipiger sp. CCB-MM3]MCA0998003.1 ABC transporter permease [Alloyangia pacifica]NDW01871.1 ABC transporter permease [Salipiger sp. PrR002]NDW59099.1 ABC transporter permease [Salipiger sp. PrR004]